MPANHAQAVGLGEAWLDVNDPGWWRADIPDAIDLATLDLEDGGLCVLGQRCPLERLDTFMSGAYEDVDDTERLSFRYQAQVDALWGGRLSRESLRDWGRRHGFLTVVFGQGAPLTAEWKQRITARRQAARDGA